MKPLILYFIDVETHNFFIVLQLEISNTHYLFIWSNINFSIALLFGKCEYYNEKGERNK